MFIGSNLVDVSYPSMLMITTKEAHLLPDVVSVNVVHLWEVDKNLKT
jgi:hypothetical protein